MDQRPTMEIRRARRYQCAMGAITSLFAAKALDVAGPAVDRAGLARAVGLAPDGAPRMISDIAYYEMLEGIARQLGDAAGFPMALGAAMHCDDYGAFGLAWKTAPTLRGSLRRAERYAALLTSVTGYELCDHEAGACFLVHRAGARRLGMRLSNEATLASVASIARQISGAPFTPLEVRFAHPAPGSCAAHEAYFGCPVAFDAGMDGLVISANALARPNRLGDPAISQFLTAHLDQELAARPPEPPFAQAVLGLVSDQLSEGPPRAAALARALGMSERTLHRRLADDGLSFQAVLRSAQSRLAEGLLAKSGHSIAEIAFLTGFAEQSSFSRAFKRWTGRTPAAFREAHAPA